MKEKKFVVAARVDDKKDCIIAPADAVIMATHRVVFGPETKQNCEKWIATNCK